MSGERFNVKLEEFLRSHEGKNSRIMPNEAHAASVDFITRSEASGAEPQEG